MNFIQKLERRFGKYAIPNLMLYLILLNAVGMVLSWVYPSILSQLAWSMRYILKGQVWRIVTFVLIPVETSPLMFLIYGYLYYSIGLTLERTWGTFRFNLYIFAGLIGTILAGVLVYAVSGGRVDMTNMQISYLTSSLFLAMAMTYPDATFLLFFFIPVKAKWLALLSALMYLYPIAQTVTHYGWIPYGICTVIMTVVSMINFIVYFFLTRNISRVNPAQIHRRNEFRRKMQARPDETSGSKKASLHKCAVCGRTEVSNPELEFRYCSKCIGAFEYCNEHLYTHQHVTGS